MSAVLARFVVLAAMLLAAPSLAKKPPARPPATAKVSPASLPTRVNEYDHLQLAVRLLRVQLAEEHLRSATVAAAQARQEVQRLERDRDAYVRGFLETYRFQDGDTYDDDPTSPTYLAVRRAATKEVK